MSVFTSRVTEIVPMQNDPGQSVTIRKLAPRHLEAASKEQQRKSLAELKEIGPAFLKEMQGLSDEKIKEAKQADPLLLFDRIVLLEKSVVAWTYPEALTAESFNDLDESTLDVLARAILKLSKPALFQTAEEQEAAQVKG